MLSVLFRVFARSEARAIRLRNSMIFWLIGVNLLKGMVFVVFVLLFVRSL